MRRRTGSRTGSLLALRALLGSGRAALFTLALGLSLSVGARAAGTEVELSATADRDEVPLDGTVTLQVTATLSSKDDSGQLQLPGFRDFDVVSRSQSEQMSFAFSNGAPSFRRTTVTTLALTPHHAGQSLIEPATFVLRGKNYVTQPISIKVLAAGQSPSAPKRGQQRAHGLDPFGAQPGSAGSTGPDEAPGESRDDGLDPFHDLHPGSKDLLLRASVDHDRPFVGQQVTYSLYLLSRINVSGIDKLQLPRLDGFWSEEIEAPQQLTGEARIIDGVPYRAFLLRKRALFPLRAGKASVEPAEVEVLTGFGMLFSRSNARRQSQELTLDVQPLPPGKPGSFDPGNVGDWRLNAHVEPLAVAVGQPVTFKLLAMGHGNVRDLALPKLPVINGLRAYDATSTDKQSIEQGQITGTRTVEQLLVPQRTGELEIPALTMEIFDPLLKQYRTLRTESVRLTVGPALSGPASALGANDAQQNLLGSGGVRPIRLRLSQTAVSPPPWTRPWFWPLLAVGPFGLALLIATGHARRLLASDPERERMRKAGHAARKRLRGAEALLGTGDGVEFTAEIARALTGYLADKQGIVAGGLTRDELARAMSERGHKPVTVKRLLQTLEECDRARFAPGGTPRAAQEQMLARADALLGELDRERKEAA